MPDLTRDTTKMEYRGGMHLPSVRTWNNLVVTNECDLMQLRKEWCCTKENNEKCQDGCGQAGACLLVQEITNIDRVYRKDKYQSTTGEPILCSHQ